MTEDVRRKLTTILCADVKGYSRLMGVDEVGTLATLKDYRGAMGRLIERHRGRVVNVVGDGLMAEFDSVVEAVTAAAEIQTELATRNHDRPADRRMEFRIGINLGDVIVDGDDLYGEGVNIAARLEGLAEAGGICVSGTVYDQVKNKLSIGFDFLGDQDVKNIADHIPVYRVHFGGESKRDDSPRSSAAPASPAGSGDAPMLSPKTQKLGLTLGAVAIFLFLINVFSGLDDIWFHWPVLVLGLVFGLAWVREHGGESRHAFRQRYRKLAIPLGALAVFFILLNVFSGTGYSMYARGPAPLGFSGRSWSSV